MSTKHVVKYEEMAGAGTDANARNSFRLKSQQNHGVGVLYCMDGPPIGQILSGSIY